MKLETGLYSDSAEVDQPAGSYRFAKNFVDSNTPGAKENEQGFTNINWGLVYPFLGFAAHDVIGVIQIDTGFVIFSTDEINSEIGVFTPSTNVYNVVYSDIGNTLNLRRSAPIKGEYRITATGDREIVWIEDINPPRIMNIDDLSGINTVNDLNIFQDLQNPAISSYSISDSGGSLPVAAYVIITRYKGLDKSVTNWYVHDKTFYINDEPKSTSFNLDDGAPGLTASNKAINITLSDVDTNFDNLEVGFIRIASSVTTAYSALIKAVSGTLNITITGAENLSSVSLEEVLTANATYDIAKAITQVNNQLVLANLTSTALPSFQPYANAIEINYNHSLVNVISNTSSHKDVLPPSFMPGDVYAFYIGLELIKGGWVFYHIPGRPPLAGETDSTTTDGLTYLKYQVDDTADSGGAATNMGYWENTTETYPDNAIYDGTIAGGPNLRGLNVRHHRFPTVYSLENSYYNGDATVGVSNLVRLGIDVSNVNIPVGIQSQVKRWKIFFAKKSPANSIIGGSDLLQFFVSGADSPSVYWTTGGNWTIDAATTGWIGMDTVHKDAVMGHCLDHLFAPNEFTPDFAYFHYGLTNNTVNAGGPVPIMYNGFRGGGSQLSTTGTGRGQTAAAVLDYTEPSTTKIEVVAIKKLNNYQYISQNSKVGVFKSAYAESFYAATMTTFPAVLGLFDYATASGLPSLQTKGSGDAPPSPVQFSAGEQTVFFQYGKIVSNAHTSFTGQDLVPLESYAAPATTSLSNVYGGDTFLCYMSYLTAGPLTSNQASKLGSPTLQGVRMWKAYVGYSRRNWNYRHQVTGNPSTYYYGKTDVTTLFSPALSTPVTGIETGTLLSSTDTFNQVTYNPDFNALDIYNVGVTYSVDLVNATSFPDLIIYSLIQGAESADVNWRIFPAGNRFTMPKNKGAIINVQGISNRDLIIHLEGSIYKTRTDVGMASGADGENIFLKSNDLFAIVPEELVSTSGWYGGTQNKFACVMTKAGYVFPDDRQGKVFLFSDKLEEISSNGMRKFFRDNMGISSDNPFTGNGYTAVYDEKINRIILSKKQGGTSWTASYNPTKKIWVSFHDYVPDVTFSFTDNKLYSVKSNKLYLHNSNAPGTFYDGVVYPAIIDAVQAPEPDKDKVFVSSNWLTESYNPSGVLQFTDTFNYITLRSLDYATGRIPLVLFTDIDSLYTSNMRNLNRVWYYNDIRDISLSPGFTLDFYNNYNLDSSKLNTNMEWYDRRKFIDKFVICRLEYSNTSGNRLLLLDNSIEYRYASK